MTKEQELSLTARGAGEARKRDLLPDAFVSRHTPTLPSSARKRSGKFFVGYRRNSIEETTEKSQARQKSNIDGYGARTHLIRLRDDFADEGVTGTSTHDRVAFMELMDLVATGQVDVVVVEDVDRFSRNFADTLKYHELLVRHGVELHDVKHGLLNLAHVTILGFMAAEGRVRLLEVMGSGKRKAVENGRHMGPPIYGYRKHPTKRGERVVVPERADVVRRIYELAAAGVGTQTIARTLTDDGVPSPRQCAEEDALRALPQKPFRWCRTEVRHLITNPLTMGVLIWGRIATTRDHQTKHIVSREKRSFEDLTVAESTALRIVEPDLWAAANASLKARSFGSGSERSRSQVYLMTPVTTCGVCGSRMHVVQTNGRPTYVCSDSRTYVSGRCEANWTLRTDWLERHVVETLSASVLTPERIAAFKVAYELGFAESDAARLRRLAEVRGEAGRIDGLLDASMREPVTAGLSTARIEKWRHGMEAQLADLRERERVLARRGDPTADLARLDTLARGLDHLAANAPMKIRSGDDVALAGAFRRLVPVVVVEPPEKDGTRRITMEVDMTAVVEPDPAGADERATRWFRTVLDARSEARREAEERGASADRGVEAEAAAAVAGDLDDAAWALVEPLVGAAPPVDGREPRDVVDGMLLVARTGARRDLSKVPARLGDAESFRRAVRSLIYHDVWDAVVAVLRERRPDVLEGVDLGRFETTCWPRRSRKLTRRFEERADDRPVEDKRAELEAAIAASVDAREMSRLRAALAWVNGCAESTIAKYMGVSQAHVYDVTAAYRRLGVQGLAAKVRSGTLPAGRKLAPDQEAAIVALAVGGIDPERTTADGHPAPIRYDDLVRIAEAKFAASFSRVGMLQLLRRSGVRLADVRQAGRPGAKPRRGPSPPAAAAS